MTNQEAALLGAITEAVRQRIILHVVPAHALDRDLQAFRPDLKATARDLADAGLITTGLTLNSTYYGLPSVPGGLYDNETRTKIMNEFEKTIKAHLDGVAERDPDGFGAKYREALAREDKKKDITRCCNFIIEEVRKSGRRGFTDDEVFGMAIHFYDESNVTGPDKAPGGQVVVNHEVKLSAEEVKKIQESARKEAEEKVRREELERIEKARKAAEERARKAEERRKEEAERKAAEAKEKARMEGCLFLFEDEEDLPQ